MVIARLLPGDYKCTCPQGSVGNATTTKGCTCPPGTIGNATTPNGCQRVAAKDSNTFKIIFTLGIILSYKHVYSLLCYCAGGSFGLIKKLTAQKKGVTISRVDQTWIISPIDPIW